MGKKQTSKNQLSKNQLGNLRRRKKTNTSSKYKGVCKMGNKYRVRIAYNGERIYLGFFDTEIEAARMYDKKAIELYGNHAICNFQNDGSDNPYLINAYPDILNKKLDKTLEFKILDEYPNYKIYKNGVIENIITGNTVNICKTTEYLSVSLKNKDKNFRKILHHRILAQAFIPNPGNKRYVKHINGNIYDNRIENLKWYSKLDSKYSFNNYYKLLINKIQFKNHEPDIIKDSEISETIYLDINSVYTDEITNPEINIFNMDNLMDSACYNIDFNYTE